MQMKKTRMSYLQGTVNIKTVFVKSPIVINKYIDKGYEAGDND